MRKIIRFIIVLIILGNIVGVVYLLSKNEDSIYSLYQMTQSRELYSASRGLNNNNDFTVDDLTERVKDLKIASSQCWFLYDISEKSFILYKDKANQHIDKKISKVFESYKNDYDDFLIMDESNNELLITLKKVSIPNGEYIIGVCEYTSVLAATSDTDLFSTYILLETILLSLFGILLGISKITDAHSHKRAMLSLKREFDDYKHRYASDTDEDKIEEKKKKRIEKNEEGVYNKAFLDGIIPKLKNNNLPYNVFLIKKSRLKILEDVSDTFDISKIFGEYFKIESDDEHVIILMIKAKQNEIEAMSKYVEEELHV